MGGVLKRVVTAATAATVVTAATAAKFSTNSSHPVLPYDTYHITLSDFALRPPMSGRFVSNFTPFYDHSSLYWYCGIVLQSSIWLRDTSYLK
jgi:hypothetical protein